MSNCEKEFTCIAPEYVKYFKCEGDICGGKCCKGFQVDIDRQTHEKYKGITNRPLRSKILDSLIWNQPTQTYRMKLKGGVCPMLQPDSLCLIQKYFGEDFLSDTCADFPRRTYVIDNVSLRSMSLTCPTAARLALLNSQPLKFEEMTFKTTHANSFFYRSVNEVPTRKYILSLQKIAFEILQDRRLSINERLATLGIVYSEVDAMIAKGRTDVLDLVINVYHSEDYFKSLRARLNSFKFHREHYLRLMFGLMDKIFAKAVAYYSPDQRNFAKYIPKAFGFSLEEPSKPLPVLFEIYEKIIEEYKKRAYGPFNHVLENYVVHSFFAGTYPCHVQGGVMNNYFLYLTLYKFFELGLISMIAVEGDKFTIYDLLEFVGRFSHRIDHGTSFRQITLDYISKLQQWPEELLTTLVDLSV